MKWMVLILIQKIKWRELRLEEYELEGVLKLLDGKNFLESCKKRPQYDTGVIILSWKIDLLHKTVRLEKVNSETPLSFTS